MLFLKKHFCNLNNSHLSLLQKSLNSIIHNFCKYNYIQEQKFKELLNKNESLYISFVLILLPYYKKKLSNIYSLNDLFFNSLYTNKFSEIDKKDKLNSEQILNYNTNALINTIRICSNKFYVNRTQIIPMYMNDYKNTQLYIDTKNKITQNQLSNDDDIGLSNDDIFNTIFNDLYFNLIPINFLLEESFSEKKALDSANKYFPQYKFFTDKKINQKDWGLYLDEVQSIYEHTWYSKRFIQKTGKISNLQLYHLCRKFTNSSKKKIWFSLSEDEKNEYIQKFYSIESEIKEEITDIIFQSLIIKGVLSTFSFSVKHNYLPESYFFLTGKNHPILHNQFYTMNFISQLNFFHHYIHHRIVLLTGGTGVGKSTQAPILLMYADIMLYYDLYSQTICSVPRKNAVENNADRIFSSLQLQKNIDYNVQFQHSENNYLYPYEKYSKTNLKIVTDEILKNILKQNLFCIKKGNVTINHIIIDESHEHKINMDFILTILKHSLFLYNRHTKLFIISATMDEDDLNYRTFFKSVLDKDIFFSNKHPYPQYLDRRLHISEFNKPNNFTITEYYDSSKMIENYTIAENKAIQLLKKISFSTKNGNILAFSIGIKEIESMIIKLNKIIPTDTIAVPLYSKYSSSYRNSVSSSTFLDTWHYDKSYVLEILNNYPDTWHSFKLPFPKKKYTRYIIIGTNIVEASLTIESLKYVVDTGFEKVAIYDYEKKKEILHIKPISESSRIQRRGRVGRVSGGYVYYAYTKDERKNNKIQKEIQNKDISTYLFDIIGFNKIDVRELDNTLKENKQVYIDGFSIHEICKKGFFIIHPTLNISNFFYEQKQHFLWKSLFNFSFYKKIQDMKLQFKSKYLNNNEAIIILHAYYLFNKNDFINFIKANIIDKYEQKDMNLLLSFLQNKTGYSYLNYKINKHNICQFL